MFRPVDVDEQVAVRARSEKPGFGVLGGAMGGLRHLTGEPGRVPVRVGVAVGHTLAALHGVIGLLMALHHRNAHGEEGESSTSVCTKRCST